MNNIMESNNAVLVKHNIEMLVSKLNTDIKEKCMDGKYSTSFNYNRNNGLMDLIKTGILQKMFEIHGYRWEIGKEDLTISWDKALKQTSPKDYMDYPPLSDLKLITAIDAHKMTTNATNIKEKIRDINYNIQLAAIAGKDEITEHVYILNKNELSHLKSKLIDNGYTVKDNMDGKTLTISWKKIERPY